MKMAFFISFPKLCVQHRSFTVKYLTCTNFFPRTNVFGVAIYRLCTGCFIILCHLRKHHIRTITPDLFICMFCTFFLQKLDIF